MQRSPTAKAIILLAALVVLLGVALKFFPPARPEPRVPPSSAPESGSPPSKERSRRLAAPTAASDSQESVDFDWRRVFNSADFPPPLPRDAIEEYLERHRRSAASLLAAFHAARSPEGSDGNLMYVPTGGLDYLKEAATNFPNDPKVQLAVLANDVFPEDRRKWLDAFKAAAPDNPLANYLSAREYLKAGQNEAAVNELLEATRKPEFRTYAMESRLEEEQMNTEAGRSAVQSKLSASGWAGDLVLELATFKGLAQDTAALQQQYLGAGDRKSAEHLAQMGVAFARQLGNSDDGKFVVSRMTGMALESIALQYLDPNTGYDFLRGRTPAQELADNEATRASIRALTQSKREILPNLTETELLSYTERARIYGEVDAMRWLQQRHGAAGGGGNQ